MKHLLINFLFFISTPSSLYSFDGEIPLLKGHVSQCYNKVLKKWETDIDYAKLEKLASSGNVDCQKLLVELYLGKYGAVKDVEKAINWCKTLPSSDMTEYKYKIGLEYLVDKKQKDFNKAVRWLKEASQEGNIDAKTLLSSVYYEGIGTPKDMAKAFYWFLESAKGGDVESMYTVACMYMNGEGTQKNVKEAVSWFTKAAQKNYVKAQTQLANIYLRGIGVEENFIKAEHWFKKAGENGDIQSVLHLSCIYLDNEAYNDAEKILIDAYNQNKNNAEILDMIANLYLEKKEYEKSKEYLLKAVKIIPDNVVLRRKMACIYSLLYDFKNAKEQWLKVVELSKDMGLILIARDEIELINKLNIEQKDEKKESQQVDDKVVPELP